MDNEDRSRGETVLAIFFEFIRNPYQTPEEVWKKLDITKDKYYRYFSEISRVVPVRYSRKQKCFQFICGTELKGFLNNPEEFYTFLLAIQAAGRGRTGKESVLEKKFKDMPGFGPDFDAMSKFIIFISPNDSSPQLTKNLSLINNAVQGLRKIKFTYTKVMNSETTLVTLEPYRIVFDQCWYLTGFALEREAVRNYRISRMKNIIITSEKFQLPQDEELKIKRSSLPWDFDDAQPVKIVLEFTESLYGYLKEKALHPTEKFSKIKDGKFLYTINITSPQNIVGWVLSFETQVKVIEPEFFRNKVIKKIRDMSSIYSET